MSLFPDIYFGKNPLIPCTGVRSILRSITLWPSLTKSVYSLYLVVNNDSVVMTLIPPGKYTFPECSYHIDDYNIFCLLSRFAEVISLRELIFRQHYNNSMFTPDYLDIQKFPYFTDILNSVQLKKDHINIYDSVAVTSTYQQLDVIFRRKTFKCEGFKPTIDNRYTIDILIDCMDLCKCKKTLYDLYMTGIDDNNIADPCHICAVEDTVERNNIRCKRNYSSAMGNEDTEGNKVYKKLKTAHEDMEIGD